MFTVPAWFFPEAAAEMERERAVYVERFRRATPLEVSNVCEFFYAESTKEVWQVGDFRSLAPKVAPQIFFEMSRPSKIVSELYGATSSETLPPRWGILLEAVEIDKVSPASTADDPLAKILETHEAEMARAWVEMGDQIVSKIAAGGGHLREARNRLGRTDRVVLAAAAVAHLTRDLFDGELVAELEMEFRPRDVRHILCATLFIETGEGQPTGAVAHWTIFLDERGRVWQEPCFTVCGAEPGSEKSGTLGEHYERLIYPALMAQSLLPKATLVRHEIDPELERARRRRARQSESARQVEIASYYTFDLAGLKGSLWSASDLVGGARSRAGNAANN